MALQVFINKCLRKILQLTWSDGVSNIELWQRSGQTSVEESNRRRKWKWLGHALQKPSCSITRKALTWNPLGKRKRGRRTDHLQTFARSRDQCYRQELVSTREGCTGQEAIKRDCWWWPMLLRRSEGRTLLMPGSPLASFLEFHAPSEILVA